MAASANYVFLPWVRQGASSDIQTVDDVDDTLEPAATPTIPGVVQLTVQLNVNNQPGVEQTVRLHGPGDVTGIDTRQILRTEPRHLSTDFEPNYFPLVEFDRPEFPWLFTPARSGKNERLRPWLCLVVVRKRVGITLRTDPTLPLPILDVDKPESELPDPSECWAWAHAQIAGSGKDDASLDDFLSNQPALTLSRLICPRRLDPLTNYIACVVPTFKLGCLAGLGKKITREDEDKLDLAWKRSDSFISLPVYFHWEFRTGVGDDFESLVDRLTPVKMPEEVGKRPLDISQGFESTAATAASIVELEGALRVRGATPAPWPTDSRRLFQARLKKILDARAEATTTNDTEPLLAPPIYGEWHAARHTVKLPSEPPVKEQWLDELNLDPRHRGVAALGTQVVQVQQEQLMASAWQQLGEIQRVNRILRQAQLARAVSGALHTRHFARFSDESLLKVIAPAQSRVVIKSVVAGTATRTSLSNELDKSFMPAKAVSAPMRKLTRSRSAINNRVRNEAASSRIVSTLNTVSFVANEKRGARLVLTDMVSAQVPALAQTVTFARSNVDNALPHAQFRFFPEGEPTPPQRGAANQTDGPLAKIFRGVVKGEQDYLRSTFITFIAARAPSLNLNNARTELLGSVNPELTITNRLKGTIRGPAPQREDALEPIMDAPEFEQPMYEALRDLSQDFLFPGLDKVPADSITLLETNAKFVEAFMVGLNAEFARELLWRNYPTDQRGTYFRRFWDVTDPAAEKDIDALTQWGTNELGKNARFEKKLVLLIRGELLRRYPNSVIYAVPAKMGSDNQLGLDPNAAEFHPIFRGTLKPDVTFIGFDLTEKVALDGLGWFFVIQQQPTEPRFGLDKFTSDLKELVTWNDLSWRHFAENEDVLMNLSHVSTKTKLKELDQTTWGHNSAHQAYITLQRPVRVAIHAKDMLPK